MRTRRPARAIARRHLLLALLAVLSVACSDGAGDGLLPSTSPSTALREIDMPQQLQELEAEAREQLQAQLDELERLRSTEAPDTRLAEAYGELGLLFYAYGFDPQAIDAFANAETLDSEDAGWPHLQALASTRQGELDAAIEAYGRSLERDAENLAATVRLAELHFGRGESERAAELLRPAVERDDGIALAHFLLGQIALESDRAEEAARRFETALALQPEATRIHYPASEAYRKLGDGERSQSHLAQRGDGPIFLDDPHAEAASALRRGSNLDFLRGHRMLQAGRFAESVAAFERAVLARPDLAEASLGLGRARAALGDHAGAGEAFEQGLAIDPSDDRLLYQLARSQQARGFGDAAIETLIQAAEANPSNSDVAQALGHALRQADRCAEAVTSFERALAIVPSAVAPRLELAMCLARLERFAEARDQLEIGYLANPRHPGIRDGLARLLAASPSAEGRDAQRALEMARALVRELPRSETLATLAMAQAATGDFAEAVKTQSESIARASRQDEEWLGHLASMLERYTAGEPAPAPWPAFLLSR